MKTCGLVLGAGAIVALSIVVAAAQTPAVEEETVEQLPDFPGREDTFGTCVACHSFKVVGRQGMDRARWDATLDWMTEKHAMPPPDAATRKVILDYLAQAFPAKTPTPGGFVSPFAPR